MNTTFKFRCSVTERRAIRRLARHMGTSESEAVRFLINLAASEILDSNGKVGPEPAQPAPPADGAQP